MNRREREQSNGRQKGRQRSGAKPGRQALESVREKLC